MTEAQRLKKKVSTHAIHQAEEAFFDEKAEQDVEGFEKGGWLADPSAHRSTLDFWGLDANLEGKKVLECGCGSGFLSVLLARMGAEVWCFDLSPRSIELTRERARRNGVENQIRATVSAMEDLDYEDGSFDLVVGKNILHHIPRIEEAGKQIRRVLKVGGRAVFYELSASNPVLMFFRRHVIGTSSCIPKLGTPDEHPLTSKEVQILSAIFNRQCKISHPKFRFFGKLDRQVFQQRFRLLSFLLEGMDRTIYTLFPSLRKYSYKILLDFTK